MLDFTARRVRLAPGTPFLIVVLLLVNLVLGACSDEAATPTTTSKSSIAPTQPAGTPAVAEETSSPPNINFKPDNKTFIFGLAQEPVAFSKNPNDPTEGIGLDPANLTDHSSLQVTRQIYDTLFEYKPGSMQYQHAPFIKPNGVEVSEDGLTYTIRIGGGLRFSDNTVMDADAIRFNFLRWANPGNIAHKGEFWAYRYYFVEQQGYPGYPGIIDLDNLKATDSRTLVIKLKKPMSSFFQVLAMPQFGIVAPSSFDTKGNLVKPTGSGPYMVDKPYDKSLRPEQRYMTLKRNPYYTVEKDEKLLPKRSIETIVLRVLPANQDGLKALRDQQVSATDKIKPEDVTNNSNDPLFEIKRRQALNISFLAMNEARTPFDKQEVREAFAYAINTEALVQNYYQGLGKPAAGLLPPAALGYRVDLKPHPYDPEKAKELLVQAGYLQGTISTPIELWVLPVPRLYYPDPTKIADAIISDLARINVTVVRKDESWVSYDADRSDGRFSLFMSGWQGENGDPDEFFYPFFGEERKDLGYFNPELQKLIADARSETDLADRRPLYRQADDQLAQDLPVIPLAYTDWPVAVRRDINGYDPSPSGIENWANLSVK